METLTKTVEVSKSKVSKEQKETPEWIKNLVTFILLKAESELKRAAKEYDQFEGRTGWNSCGKRFGLLREHFYLIKDSFDNHILVADIIYPAYRDGVAKWINEGCIHGRYESRYYHPKSSHDKRNPKTRLMLLKKAIETLETEIDAITYSNNSNGGKWNFKPVYREFDAMRQEILKLEIG